MGIEQQDQDNARLREMRVIAAKGYVEKLRTKDSIHDSIDSFTYRLNLAELENELSHGVSLGEIGLTQSELDELRAHTSTFL